MNPEYQQLKQQYEDLQARKRKAEARREVYLEKLKSFGCDGVTAAEALLEADAAALEALSIEMNRHLARIREALSAD